MSPRQLDADRNAVADPETGSALRDIVDRLIAEFKTAATVSIAAGGLNVALCAVFVMLISRISRLQIETIEQQIEAIEHKSTLAVFGP